MKAGASYQVNGDEFLSDIAREIIWRLKKCGFLRDL